MADDVDVLQRLLNEPQLLEVVTQSTEPELALQSRLRETYPAELVRGAMILRDLRIRARAKFSRADQMWFDRQGLEQATAEPIAAHKAQRFRDIRGTVYDLCCGIGSDSIALAGVADQVVSIDRSPAACLRTRLNAEVYGLSERVETRVQDVATFDVTGGFVHIDPDRRAGRNRAVRIEDYEPSLEFLSDLIARSNGGGIKLSPATNFGGKFPECEIELISWEGECKEATVWFGSLRGDTSSRATILPANVTYAGNPWEYRSQSVPLGSFIYDPDPAIVRSGLLDLLTEQSDLKRLDDAEEYLTSDELVITPAARAFEVLVDLPNNQKEIRRYFRDADFGEVEIKSRHVPTDVEALRRKLPLSGKNKAVLFIARLQGKTRAIIARRQSSVAPGGRGGETALSTPP